MINDLASESAKFGLKLNPEKTKIMTNGKKDPVTVEQTQISYVDEYIYLGQLISPEDNINKEVERRIAKGWKKYWGAKEIMKDKNLHISTKSKLFNTCILPVLTYGSETWALTRNIAKKLSTCQHAMERSMVGIKRKDKWYPRDGKRKRGRPQRRWDDDIRQVAGTTWGRVAIERREWRRLKEAFATWQTDIQNMNKRNIKDVEKSLVNLAIMSELVLESASENRRNLRRTAVTTIDEDLREKIRLLRMRELGHSRKEARKEGKELLTIIEVKLNRGHLNSQNTIHRTHKYQTDPIHRGRVGSYAFAVKHTHTKKRE
ncbi:Putative uncharacterized transposon-derived protein F52C9.6 [Eumeta japonica]|uniref:Uncharacterized transposon-derived protein F52C9.6 n=1 Tax=Eumeta variegata TaxID=151549 RepID=A0A4C1YFQ9_EUMVA|nr:Putative uncharacterized transposon-derived protein F52C9.6 [Eumeta japonica]